MEDAVERAARPARDRPRRARAGRHRRRARVLLRCRPQRTGPSRRGEEAPPVRERPLTSLLRYPKPVIAAINGRVRRARPRPRALLRRALRGERRQVLGAVRPSRVFRPSSARRGCCPRLVGRGNALDLLLSGRMLPRRGSAATRTGAAGACRATSWCPRRSRTPPRSRAAAPPPRWPSSRPRSPIRRPRVWSGPKACAASPISPRGSPRSTITERRIFRRSRSNGRGGPRDGPGRDADPLLSCSSRTRVRCARAVDAGGGIGPRPPLHGRPRQLPRRPGLRRAAPGGRARVAHVDDDGRDGGVPARAPASGAGARQVATVAQLARAGSCSASVSAAKTVTSSRSAASIPRLAGAASTSASTIVRALLAGETVDFAGRIFQVEQARILPDAAGAGADRGRRPVRRPRFRRAARLGRRLARLVRVRRPLSRLGRGGGATGLRSGSRRRRLEPRYALLVRRRPCRRNCSPTRWSRSTRRRSNAFERYTPYGTPEAIADFVRPVRRRRRRATSNLAPVAATPEEAIDTAAEVAELLPRR